MSTTHLQECVIEKASRRIVQLESKVEKLEDEVDYFRKACKEQVKVNVCLRSDIEKHDGSIATLNKEMRDMNEKHDGSIATLNKDMRDMNEKHDKDMRDMNEKHDKEMRNMQKLLQTQGKLLDDVLAANKELRELCKGNLEIYNKARESASGSGTNGGGGCGAPHSCETCGRPF